MGDEKNHWPLKVGRKAWTALYVLGVIALGLLACLCVSCSTARQVLNNYEQSETHRIDTVYVQKQSRDSIYILDSVYVHEKSDTVYVEKYKYLYRDKLRTDTLYLSKVDSVYVETQKIVEVEKSLTRWQKMQKWGFWVLLLLIVGWIVYKVRK